MKKTVRLQAAILLWTLALLARASAQDAPEEDKIPFDFTVSGFLDASAHFNFNHPRSGTSALRSYDAKSDSFYLNAVHVAVSADFGEGVAATVEADAGSDAAFNRTGSVETVEFDLQEAYATYVHPGTGLGLKGGKFATFMGIEVIESPDNPTITRGFLYGLAECFTHTGFVATWQGGPFDAALGAVNGWDAVTDNNRGKTAVGKLTVGAKGLGVTASFLAGPEQEDDDDSLRRSFDVTGFGELGRRLRLNLQANWGDDEVEALSSRRVRWYGAGLQPVATLTDAFSIGLRMEWFKDPDGARTGVAGGTTVTNLTLAPALRLTENLTVRLEGRYDAATEDAFEDDRGDPTDRQGTVSGEMILRF